MGLRFRAPSRSSLGLQHPSKICRPCQLIRGSNSERILKSSNGILHFQGVLKFFEIFFKQRAQPKSMHEKPTAAGVTAVTDGGSSCSRQFFRNVQWLRAKSRSALPLHILRRDDC